MKGGALYLGITCSVLSPFCPFLVLGSSPFISEGEEDKRLIMFLNKDLGANNIGSFGLQGPSGCFLLSKGIFFSVKKKYKPVHKSRLAHTSK